MSEPSSDVKWLPGLGALFILMGVITHFRAVDAERNHTVVVSRGGWLDPRAADLAAIVFVAMGVAVLIIWWQTIRKR